MVTPLACRACGTPAPTPSAWRCACGQPFRLLDAADLERADLGELPIPTLGQGHTPLIPSPIPETDGLHLKLEGANPSGSFKDRGMALLIGLAAQLGVPDVVCDSSGNAAAAVAAFAAAAGLGCRVFVPADTADAKMRQIRAYGAELVRIPGDRAAAAHAAQAAATKAFYASHYWHPYFAAGTRSFALETAEQLPDSLPDHLLFPVGHGSLYLGAAAGFLDLARERGVAAPRCHVVQARACDPVVAAATGRPASPAATTTLAEGIRIRDPLRLPEILAALHATRGQARSVEEDEIGRWWRQSARAGVLLEPTSAVALAGYDTLRREGVITAGETVVVPITGHGLKTLTGPLDA